MLSQRRYDDTPSQPLLSPELECGPAWPSTPSFSTSNTPFSAPSPPRSSIRELDAQDAGYALVWDLTVVLLVPIQLASLILFDSTGLDAVVPDLLFAAVGPGVALAATPTVVARHRYSPLATRATAGVAVGAFYLAAAYAMQFYGMCGPGC